MVNPRTGVIIQARLNSSRLPGKVLLPLPQQEAKTILDHIIERAGLVQPRPEIVLATSTSPENEVLEAAALKNNVHFFRGDEQDVLARFYHAAKAFRLETIVRLTADNPFVDPVLLSQTLRAHEQTGADYTSTTGLPLGTNLEIFSFRALNQAFHEARLPEHREHVTPYIRLHPGLFSLHHQEYSGKGLGQAAWRLTIDNESDYAFACALVLALGPQPQPASLAQVASLLTRNPALLTINKDNYQKKVFASIQEEIAAAVALLRFHDLNQAAAILHKTQR
jgi:spore coat polysaccharide biosynthesis protein SpsF